MRRSRIVLGFVLVFAGLAVATTAGAAPRQGLSLGFGLGVASGSEDEGSVVEAQLAYDIGAARLGVHYGKVYSSNDGGYDLQHGTSEERSGGEMMFTPLEFDLSFMPLRLFNRGNRAFQPYIGIGMGTVDTGGGDYDGYELSIAPVVRAGVDFYFGEWTVLGLEFAQHSVKNDTDSRDFDYTTFMLQFRFRIPIVRRHLVAATGGSGGSTAAENDGAADPDQEAAAAAQPGAGPKRLRDGETAVIATLLEPDAATRRVKEFFNSKDVDYTVNPDSGRVISDWFDERRCGPGFQKCANRATVRVATEEGRTVIRVQVIERKREAGLVDKPWNENSTSRGEATARMAAELESFLAQGLTQ